MAGTKRNIETSQAAAETPRGRGGRARGVRGASRARPSRSGRGRGGAASSTAENISPSENTTAAESGTLGQDAASAQNDAPAEHEGPAEDNTHIAETPRIKRRKVLGVEETRPTRHSARIKVPANSWSSSETSPSQDLIASPQRPLEDLPTNSKMKKKPAAKLDDSNAHSITDMAIVKSQSPAETPAIKGCNARVTRPLSIGSDDHKLQSDTEVGDSLAQQLAGIHETDTTKTPHGRKRRIEQTEGEEPTDLVDSSSNPEKKLKLEDEEFGRTLQNGTETDPNPLIAGQRSAAPEEKAVKPPQSTEESGPSPSQDDNTPSTSTRGRGRGRGWRGRGGRGRGRGAARGGASARGGRGRGRGGRGGGRGGKRTDDDSDFEFDRSPSPSPATQKLHERQKELKQAFKRLSAAQRLALNVLATLSQQRLARDKNAHQKASEYEEIQKELQAALRKRQEIIRREYELKVEEANRLFAAEKEILERMFKTKAEHIHEEHFRAAQGEYMAFVEGIQHAEDDEHTEPEDNRSEQGSVNDTGNTYLYLDIPKFKRGYNSSFVREPAGAAAYERATAGWEDFVQRAKMKEISQETGPSGPDPLLTLLEVVEATGAQSAPETAPVRSEALPMALLALADAAVEQPGPLPTTSNVRPGAHRAILPQPPSQSQPQVAHALPEPPSFLLLPRPSVPRRLLPAQHGLPDPFGAPGSGPPQLPPPPGVTFPRPFLPGPPPGVQHHQAGPQQYYYTLPPPPPPPQGPSPNLPRPY